MNRLCGPALGGCAHRPITLYDTKGGPGRCARTHTVPIVKTAVRDLQALERVGDHVFSTTKGVKPISGTTLSGWATQVVGDAIDGSQLKRVRSGVETLPAALRISQQIRGHVRPSSAKPNHRGKRYMHSMRATPTA